MSDRQQPTFNELVAKIVELSLSFTQYLGENKIPLPTLEAGSSTQYDGISAEGFVTKQQLLDHLMDLYYLVQGPSESIFNYVHNVRLSRMMWIFSMA